MRDIIAIVESSLKKNILEITITFLSKNGRSLGGVFHIHSYEDIFYFASATAPAYVQPQRL